MRPVRFISVACLSLVPLAAGCGLSVAGDGGGAGADASKPRTDGSVGGRQGADGQAEGGGLEASTPQDAARVDAGDGGGGTLDGALDANRDAKAAPPEAAAPDAHGGDGCTGDCEGSVIIVFGTDTPTAPWPEGGAAMNMDSCPLGDAITGLQGHLDPGMGYWLDLQATCGAVHVDRDTLDVTVIPDGVTVDEGDTSASANASSVSCGDNQVVVGFAANAGYGMHVYRINLICALLDAGGATFGDTVTSGTPDTVTGTAPMSGDGAWSQGIKCSPTSYAANEIDDSASGNGITSIGFGCAPMTVSN